MSVKFRIQADRFEGLAFTPPLGWNSYDCYNASVTEDEVRATAHLFSQHLAPFGWEYIVVDYCWAHPAPKLENVPNLDLLPDGRVTPLLTLDALSRQIPAENRFPSACGGAGFKPLADYLHGLGLKFGIHLMRGIPRQAVEQNLPVAGGRRAGEIADRSNVCNWLNHMYGVDMSRPGAQDYYDSLFEQYAGWGVDYVKVDDISRPYQAAEIEAVFRAVQRCGRPIVLSLSPGPAPLDQAAHVRQCANLWRISNDFWDDWAQLKEQFALCQAWAPYVTPGHWPDADMLPLGSLSVRGPQAQPRQTGFTPTEQITLLSLFAIFRSPLMVGAHLLTSDAFTFSLLTNPEVLTVNQQGSCPRVVSAVDDQAIWLSDAPEPGEKYLAVFNLSDAAQAVPVTLDALGFSGPCNLRDLWQRQDMPDSVVGRFAPYLPAHGAGLYRVHPAA